MEEIRGEGRYFFIMKMVVHFGYGEENRICSIKKNREFIILSTNAYDVGSVPTKQQDERDFYYFLVQAILGLFFFFLQKCFTWRILRALLTRRGTSTQWYPKHRGWEGGVIYVGFSV